MNVRDPSSRHKLFYFSKYQTCDAPQLLESLRHSHGAVAEQLVQPTTRSSSDMPKFSLDDDIDDEWDDDDDGGGGTATADDDEEPPHPLGFSSSPWGKTWFSLDPSSPRSVSRRTNGRSRYALDWSDDDDDDEEDDGSDVGVIAPLTMSESQPLSDRYVQSYPPLSSFVDPEVAPTSARLKCQRQFLAAQEQGQQHVRILTRRRHLEQRGDDGDDDDELNYSEEEDDDEKVDRNGENAVARLHQFVQRNLRQKVQDNPRLLMPPGAPSAASDQKAQQQRANMDAKIQKKIQSDRRKVEMELQESTRILGEIVLETEQKAASVLKEKNEQEALFRRQQEERERRQQAAREKEESDAAEQAQQEQVAEEGRRQVEERKRQAKAQEQKDKDKAVADAAKKTEYIAKAKHKVAQLVELRASLKSFEENKAMSKRRLGMKKIARGKVNTLNENAEKVTEVAQQVSKEIAVIRQEDEQCKQGIKDGNPQLTSDMTRGKRYFLDLLASNAMTRVQADSFNGLKGDGFPLAAMLSMVSTENPDFEGVFSAHVYTVCPTAIPTLPAPKKDASEDDVMASLGMLRDKNGEFESFPKFLSRTENIITFMADIQSSIPGSHKLMQGNEGACQWMGRFLDLLPPPPTAPLPLLTAPVLGAFLVGAGHMLANKHADEFKQYLTSISADVVSRLDEGPIGKPSALRLNNLLEGGFEHFQKELPPKAIPELYYGASASSHRTVETLSFGGEIGGKQEEQQVSNPTSAASNPFGGNNTAVPANNPFGSGAAAPSASPFGNASNGTALAQSPFGNPSGGNAPPPSPFGNTAAIAPSPFGSGTTAPSASPFGGGAAALGPSPFGKAAGGGGSSSSGAGPFANSGGMATSTTPFGAPLPAPGPFGAAPSSGASNPSPFGSNLTRQSSPFGANTSNSPFGGAVGQPSPFGALKQTTQLSPFGNSNSAPQNSPFGALQPTSSASPFGAGGPSPFGGVAAPSPSPFSANASEMKASPFGQSSSFGRPGLSASPSPFGNPQSTFGDGNNNNQNAPFGNSGGGSKKPCKFFAEGRCRYGNNCKFSHETGGGGGGTIGGSFGGSGFGGDGSGAFGGAASTFGGSPFGAPRR